MINPLTISNPCTLPQWLARSVAWVIACAAGFGPIGWLVSMSSGDDKGAQALCMSGLTLAQILIWTKAMSGFGGAMRQPPPATLGIKILAVLWMVLLLYLLICCALFTALGWLMMADPDPGLRF